MNKNDYVHYKELRVIEGEENIFSSTPYIIPLYQRAFAWESKQIIQLITDINDFDGNTYYLGSLVVSKRDKDIFEVIDGQQRLTALYLLLTCLGFNLESNLTFECRERSTRTLKGLGENKSIDEPDESLMSGMNCIKQKLEEMEKSKRPEEESPIKRLREKLEKVVLFRIEVPEGTDLNHYFEIMNTRGEQLEQHDILKAEFMSVLKGNSQESEAFAAIWDACSDMTGYVQMHFDTSDRKILFGDNWTNYTSGTFENFVKYREEKKKEKKKKEKKKKEEKKITNSVISEECSIEEIIKKPMADVELSDYVETENDGKVRFESIIDFPFFLLHVLKVYAKENNLGKPDELLNDQKLCDRFKLIPKEPDDVRNFIMCLLQCRFLYDKYIIKREYKGDDQEGKWSLKKLRGQNGKPIFTGTISKNENENDKMPTNILMLQACMRVSYISPKVMHWITEILMWLHKGDVFDEKYIEQFENKIESIVQTAVRNNFLANKNFNLGVATPHIVFNYLDYLLWKEDSKGEIRSYSDFNFEFRNSVEHWYPQTPSEETFEKWNDCDRLGNLCLVSRRINSKFSNKTPQSKKNDHYEMISRGSIKLRKMSELTVDNAEEKAHKRWMESICEQHENEMIELLKNACKETS